MFPGRSSTLKECEVMEGKRRNDHACMYIYVAYLIDKSANGDKDKGKDTFPCLVRGYYVIGDVQNDVSQWLVSVIYYIYKHDLRRTSFSIIVLSFRYHPIIKKHHILVHMNSHNYP